MIRTINYMMRTLFFHYHLSLTFWPETLHMEAHILNILPSVSVSNETPHYRLFQKHPTYDHLWVFGYLCFSQIHPTHKFQPRSTPCIFLGYPTCHCGLWWFDLSTRKIIISRHITLSSLSSYTVRSPPRNPHPMIFRRLIYLSLCVTFFTHHHMLLTLQ